MNKIIIAVILAAVIGIGGYFLLRGPQMPTPNSNLTASMPSLETPQITSTNTLPAPIPSLTTPQTSSTSIIQNPPSPASPPVVREQSFTVHANDSSADLTKIMVNKGATVTITFSVDANDTYHGGLDFRSPVVNTGPIAPGSSKTINFTAINSFNITPYWPTTNIQKPYTISVTVE